MQEFHSSHLASLPLNSSLTIELQKLFIRLLKDGYTIRSQAKSESMTPTIFPKDILTVVPKCLEQLKVGDIAVYGPDQTTDTTQLTTHRVIGKGEDAKKGSYLLTRGDATGWIGRGIRVYQHQVYGKVTEILRENKKIKFDHPVQRYLTRPLIRLFSFLHAKRISIKSPFRSNKRVMTHLQEFIVQKQSEELTKIENTPLETVEPSCIIEKATAFTLYAHEEERYLIPIVNKVADMEHIFMINESGKIIWENIAEKTSVENLAKALQAYYDIKEDVALSDTISMVAWLVSIGAVRKKS